MYLLNKGTVKAWSKPKNKNQMVGHRTLRKSEYVSNIVQIGKPRWTPNKKKKKKKNSYRQRLAPLFASDLLMNWKSQQNEYRKIKNNNYIVVWIAI